MKQLPTAEEFAKNNHCMKTYPIDWKVMIEFAKLHVEQALKEASEKAKVQMGDDYILSEIRIPPNSLVYNAVVKVNKDSILNSYSLDNIK